LQVASKIKNFGWRVLHGAIPCKGILANRHIENSSSCPACHEGCEILNTFCSPAIVSKGYGNDLVFGTRWREFWHQIDQGLADFINNSRPVMNLNQVGLTELILTGGWYIWWERRKFVHGEAIQQPMQSALSIASLTTNYKTAMKKSIKQREGWKITP